MSMILEIRPWRTDDSTWLRTAITDFMKAGEARGGDLLATPRNVDTYLQLGLHGAAAGDPCLVAVVDGRPVAYVMWIGVPDVVDSRYRSLNAIGSYTLPQWRSQRIAAALREEALRISRARGYERVTGPVHNTNERGIREFVEAYGAWPVATVFELLL